MRSIARLAALVLLVSTACGKDANTQLCLDDFETLKKAAAPKGAGIPKDAGLVYQTCGISCDTVKDADACKAFEATADMICDGGGKEACQTLCDGDAKKNEHACTKAASM
ncbi:MAG TPA: hypothetical protein VFG69_00090 [Nannocystaceae bacterium]|nr:hypothetical protein [Nannocystaceae bacterium]